MRDFLLLTGATGQVGQYLLRDLLLAGQPLAVLVRGRGKHSAQDRLEKILDHWEGELHRRLPRPVYFEGDITRPNCGLDRQSRIWIANHCRAVFHNAASLTFVGADRAGDPWLTNVTGTRHVLDLCAETRVRHLHYVSTAYVCGTRSSVIYENELDCGQDFRNDYEKSKFEAETQIRAAHLDSLTVYRPAIIVGDSQTGYTVTYHGPYTYMQFGCLLANFAEREPDGRWLLPVRLNLTGKERRNLVPIDWVSAVMTHILHHPEYHNQTYHLTPVEPTNAQQIEGAIAERLGYYGPTYVGPHGLDGQELNDCEKQFYETVLTYQPYWNEEPNFDLRNTMAVAPHLPCPKVDQALLLRLLDFGIADQWGKGRRTKRAVRTPATV
ncbi:MAG: SDR family oxidoreductase [Gemmataceae bacterium]